MLERVYMCVCMCVYVCVAFNRNSVLYLSGIVSFLATKAKREINTLLDCTRELTGTSKEVKFLIGVQFQEEGSQFQEEGNFNCISSLSLILCGITYDLLSFIFTDTSVSKPEESPAFSIY